MPTSDFAARHFAGKKITIMGLGLLGRGIGDVKFFGAAGADIIVTDLKTESELSTSIAELRKLPSEQFSKIVFHLGGHHLEDFENRDLIIRANNAPLDSPFIARARERGIPVEMDASLFAKLCNEIFANATASARPTIVGITGTRGKSTVTHLIYEMARAAGKNVFLGGNEKDTATLLLLNEIDGAAPLVVLELDSWQLQGFEEDRESPSIAIWTNFMPDHMNYYRGDVERYFQDKAAIARFQRAGDVFIAPRDIKEKIEARWGALAGEYREAATIPADWEVALPGEHNRVNAAFAVAAARALGIADENIKKTLREFRALPGRLEFLGEKNEILFYNDSNATTPEATIAALRALRGMPAAGTATSRGHSIILIAGGSDKQLDFAELAREIPVSVAHLVLLPGTATEKLKSFLPQNFSLTPVATMDEAVRAALSAASAGDIILLSPAATSFGLFKNEYDRAEQFEKSFSTK